jgi:hypothetical protein
VEWKTCITFVLYKDIEMRFLLSILFLIFMITSCNKEVIVPISNDSEEVMNTRASGRDNDGLTDDNDSDEGITDPDEESDEDIKKSKKKNK